MDNKKIEVSLKTIFKGSFIVLSGTAAGQLLHLLFKMIAARNFGPEDYGWFSLVLAVIVIGTNISSLGMNQTVARFIPFFQKKHEWEKLSYTIVFGLRLSLLVGLVAGLVIFIATPWLSKVLHGDRSFSVLLMLFALIVPFEVIFNYSMGILRGMKDMKIMAFCNDVIVWVARIAVLWLILLIGLGIKWMVLPYFASYVAGLIIAWAYIVKRGPLPRGSSSLFTSYPIPELRKELVSYSLPLVFSTITVMFRKRLDVILVGLFLSASQVGFYNAALPLATLTTVFVFAINRIAMPVTSELFGAESEKEMAYIYKSIAKWSLMSTLPTFFILFCFPEKIINLSFGKEYLVAADALRILAAGFFVNSISGSFGEYLQSYSKTREVFIISLTGSGINFALMVLLIPRFGIEGAAFSLSFSLAWMCLLGNLYMYHYRKILPFSRHYLNTVIIGIGLFTAVYFLEKKFTADMSDYVFAGLIGASLVIYAGMLYLFATNEFDREIMRAIRKKVCQCLAKHGLTHAMSGKKRRISLVNQMAYDRTKSVHIDYEQTDKPHHKVVATLVAKYCNEDARIIDIGCGLGHTLSYVKELLPNARLVAADIDKNCLKITAERVELKQKMLLNDVGDLFDHNDTYDAVIASHVLEHTLRPADTVKGLMRLVRPGGVLVLAVPNPVRPLVFLAALRKRHYVNRGHVCAWDRSHWINFLENIMGLDVICYSQDFIELPLLRRWSIFQLLGEWLARYFPWLSFSNIAVIRKADKVAT